MKKIVTAAFFALTFCVFCLSAGAFEGAAKDHSNLMKNEDYASAYKQMTNVMKEAKERLDPGEYKNLEQENAQAIAESVKEDTASGDSTKAEAYSTAYLMRSEYISSRVLVWDWLRKNAKGVQGFYRLKNDGAEGYVTIQESDEKNLYSVYFCVAMKENPELLGELEGIGKLEGNRMTVTDIRNEDVSVKLVFDGETATLATPEKLKNDFLENYGAVFDGKFERETKPSK